ncbi:MAG: P-loop NTPase fold protein [Limnoraphis robusta]|uniref:P-loop NTPase fold protein n=1 Tax=Limnoraphis robusta CCNP1315 TaxID=3110306 RepID=A0ABU5U651_9CYAN|nr:P-loop NTPase fold protein [Limnoraphis robusta]MEA5498842.1 P-loop NTPase fold protein [Limnoraphis robusta BA-68 BA1]MEA5522631.1 P-loop NTPase fold protein [Limnoraphis robusta CCNP1315]MEA5541902.1 P-loop NTPase fold protein [Limnoraphis robusta Tam1]MEA5546542.1 P-loop NTPase fold protein [Limnoraphis robusta CCNP1324]
MNTNSSAINALIREHNPFEGNMVVRSSQIWGKSFPDVPSINAPASNAVLEALSKINQGKLQMVGVTITGEKGVGKSQVISRIRHQLQKDEKSLFIYMGKYGSLNKIKFEFLKALASSLRVHGKDPGVMQWQEIAASLINNARNLKYTPQWYIDKFRKPSSKLIEDLVNQILQTKPEINNPYLIRAILLTLAPQSLSIYANHWLAGSELAEKQAKTLGLPNPKQENREAEAFEMACQILEVVSDYKLPVICFDELDRTDIDDNGFTTAQVVASLSKDFYNNLKRGIFLLSMYEKTWIDQVKVLPQAEAVIDRIANYPTPKQTIQLSYLNSESVVTVVSHWLKEFYDSHQVTPPSPLYPFDENKLREFGTQKPSVRQILNWCSHHWTVSGDEPSTVSHKSPVELAFNRELQEIEGSIKDAMENNDWMAAALITTFENLIGKTVNGVEVEKVDNLLGRCHVQFKIYGKDNGKEVKIGVAVVQQSNGIGVQARLNQLIDYERFDLTRGCLVRSKKISPNAKLAQQYFQQLLNEKGGKFAVLKPEHIKPILAIFQVHKNCENYELNPEDIRSYVNEKGLLINNPLIQEIISKPLPRNKA